MQIPNPRWGAVVFGQDDRQTLRAAVWWKQEATGAETKTALNCSGAFSTIQNYKNLHHHPVKEWGLAKLV
jgi:hypothetical protein